MKIILFADRLPPLIGGMETHAHYFVKYFKDEIDLYIISRKDGKDVLVDYDYNYIRHIELDDFLPQFKDEKTVLFFNCGRWIEHLTHIKELLPNSIVTYRTGGNEIIQSPLPFEMPNYKDRQNYWKNAINTTVDYLITNSDFTDKRLTDFGINPFILRHVAGGIDPETIQNGMLEKEKTKRKYGMTDSDKIVSCCARFVPYKRHEFLLEAISLCKEKLHLFLAGDGPLEEEAKEYAKKLNIDVKFLGNLSQADSVKLISASDVYVQASTDLDKKVEGGSYIHTEGMGRSLLEAICSGVPVVVTNCGAVGEYIGNQNGRLVNTKQEMADAIDYLLKNNITVKDFKTYTSNYSFTKIFEEYKKLWN